ncbi:hypothetical protein BKA93DRAFT_829537 [Sparassis latifolia]|uniref:Molybdopterin synthase sulfur carrier subunit n=1 Tax=Sparassis crispa TaxID=139825 RepID=A0A401H093_9APHY|nr:Molybdopterin synthase sulfur carrier subunit [Sparassis crispa]GBE87822.1 Molybdopterin synthase sulfur carrier subunit [Sparassis crispa]
MSTPAPEITVLYFAAASTATGLTMERVPLPLLPDSTNFATAAELTADSNRCSYPTGFPLTSLAALLSARHPHAGLGAILAGSKWAVDAEMVEEPEAVFLRGGEEVAVICPVSGG